MLDQIGNYFGAALGRIVAFLPNLISALIILLIGYVVSRVVGALVQRLLSKADFDRFVTRRVHPRVGGQPGRPASAALGSAVFWLGMLITASLAAQALQLTALAAGLNRIISYVPALITAALILGIAVAVANSLSAFIADVSSPWLARGVRVGIIVLAAFMALDQLGIARNVVNIAFIALMGAAAIAAAIAFGIGNIDLAREYSQRWERRRQGEQYVKRGEAAAPFGAAPVPRTATGPGAEPPSTPTH